MTGHDFMQIWGDASARSDGPAALAIHNTAGHRPSRRLRLISRRRFDFLLRCLEWHCHSGIVNTTNLSSVGVNDCDIRKTSLSCVFNDVAMVPV